MFLTILNYLTSPFPPSSPLGDHWLNNPSHANLTQSHPVCWDRGRANMKLAKAGI